MKAEAKITESDMRAYMFYTIYHSFSGLLSIILGVLTIGLGVFYLINGSKTGILFLVLAVVFFILQPVMIFIQAKSQAKNPVFRKATCYLFSEEQLEAWQEETEHVSVKWSQVFSMVKDGSRYYIFFDKVRANILPGTAFSGNDGAAFEELVRRMLPEKKRKGF